MSHGGLVRESALRKLGNGSLRILPFSEIDNRVRSGAYQFHDFGTFWIWTQISVYDTEKVLDVVLLLGEGFPERKGDALERLAAYGRKCGCNAIEAISRRGLEPTLKPLGFRKTRVLLRKDL